MCGFDKTKVPVQMREVSSQQAVLPTRERSFLSSFLPVAVIVLLVGYIGYDKFGWGKAPPPDERDSQAPGLIAPNPSEDVPAYDEAAFEEARRTMDEAERASEPSESPELEEEGLFPGSFFSGDDDPRPSAPAEPQRTEREQQVQLADSIYRPRMVAVAEQIRKANTLWRRYSDACLGKKTVKVRDGTSRGYGSGQTTGAGTSRGEATVYDPSGAPIADVSSQSRSSWTESSSSSWSEDWMEIETLDHETTVECQLILSELRDLAPIARRAIDEADAEAARRGVWTWLRVQTPDTLAAEVWR